ncbi:DUF397 domain-containing protein [Streptomyces turgidiscabies]|uniref:DUF397 domain-containing protein n=1 Tax=Streptomyces turgidiscabies TaxID=85558 RepID=A0ABU0RH64_9ACTN|nr:DUF397 domain-containing protein [Streptomyces turgidiscabies]MDQ0931331.1 hypothetical protein [Streptomyces turgidiscabies]
MKTARTPIETQGLGWFKSSYSGAEGGECVEVAGGPGAVYVRDSKDPAGPIFAVSRQAWAGFVGLAADVGF